MDAISQMTFSSAFVWQKMLELRIKTNSGKFTDAYMRNSALVS